MDNRRRFISSFNLLAFCVVAIVASSASAGLVAFNVDGSIIIETGVLPAPFDNIDVGDDFSFDYTFDDTATDTNADTQVGEYFGLVQQFDLSIGSDSLSGVPTFSAANVNLDTLFSPGQLVDEYVTFITTDDFAFFTIARFDENTLATDALPTTIDTNSLIAFGFLFGATSIDDIFNAQFLGAIGSIDSFTATTVIPAPAGVALAMFGFGCLRVARRGISR